MFKLEINLNKYGSVLGQSATYLHARKFEINI